MTGKRATPTELAILAILWDRGAATVREVHEVLGADRNIGYTGVLKLLQIMTAKGLVVVNKDERSHVYRAKEPAEATKRKAVGDIIGRLFPGSPGQLVLHALQAEAPSEEEIAEIRQILDEYERKSKGQ
jgi:BlaI family transcriptional regulator, penicillinase repressor